MPRSLVILGAGEALILFSAVYVAVTVGVLEINPTARLLVGPVWIKGLAYVVLIMPSANTMLLGFKASMLMRPVWRSKKPTMSTT